MVRKYIIIQRVQVVLFIGVIEHVSEANKRNVTSAGFFDTYVDENGEIQVNAYGESDSLGIKSNPKVDSLLIKKFLVG